jgi:uncharacterized membrane protein
MKNTFWKLTVGAVLLIVLITYGFLLRENISEPEVAGIPFVFWTSFVATVLIVALTFVAAKNFSHTQNPKP